MSNETESTAVTAPNDLVTSVKVTPAMSASRSRPEP
jgi:hypothetical protein